MRTVFYCKLVGNQPAITMKNLTRDQLFAVRKMLQPEDRLAMTHLGSLKTIEAVLLGARRKPEIEELALELAAKRMESYLRTFKGIAPLYELMPNAFRKPQPKPETVPNPVSDASNPTKNADRDTPTPTKTTLRDAPTPAFGTPKPNQNGMGDASTQDQKLTWGKPTNQPSKPAQAPTERKSWWDDGDWFGGMGGENY